MSRIKDKSDLCADVVASGYEYSCPHCDHFNRIVGWKEDVTCNKCGAKVILNPPEHAYD